MYFRSIFSQPLPDPDTCYSAMNNDCTEVDELLQIADYENDFASVAAEELLGKCSTTWEAPFISSFRPANKRKKATEKGILFRILLISQGS